MDLAYLRLFYFAATLFAYFAATLFNWLYYASRKRQLRHTAITFAIIGFVFQTIILIARGLRGGGLPLANLYEDLTFLSWAIVLVYLVVEYTYRIDMLGIVMLPVAFLTIAYVGTAPREVMAISVINSVWLTLHIGFALLGNATFALTFGVALLYLFQEHQLKAKKIGTWYYRLPSLEVLDTLNRQSLILGLPLLTLGIIAGSLWSRYTKGAMMNWDPFRLGSAAVTWLVFASLFMGRLTAGWQGRKAATLAIIGFLLASLTYVLHLI